MADLTLAAANSNAMFGESLEFLKLRHTSWACNSNSDPGQVQHLLAQNPAAVRPKGFAFADSGAFGQPEDLASIGLRAASCLYSCGRKAVRLISHF
jgi:hypothetical protein